MEWYQDYARLQEQAIPFVLVTLIETQGSTPREAGARCIVTKDQIYGTIGGGQLEYQSVNTARKLLAEEKFGFLREEKTLGASFGQCCGGKVCLLYEHPNCNLGSVWLFGNGHVAWELVQLLDGMGIRIYWVDSRKELFPSQLTAGVQAIVSDDYPGELARAKIFDLILVLTHSHQLDYEVCLKALQGDWPFIGLIGSHTKRQNFCQKLTKRGIPQQALGRLVCPLGLWRSSFKQPKAVAISIAAQVLSSLADNSTKPLHPA